MINYRFYPHLIDICCLLVQFPQLSFLYVKNSWFGFGLLQRTMMREPQNSVGPSAARG